MVKRSLYKSIHQPAVWAPEMEAGTTAQKSAAIEKDPLDLEQLTVFSGFTFHPHQLLERNMYAS